MGFEEVIEDEEEEDGDENKDDKWSRELGFSVHLGEIPSNCYKLQKKEKTL